VIRIKRTGPYPPYNLTLKIINMPIWLSKTLCLMFCLMSLKCIKLIKIYSLNISLLIFICSVFLYWLTPIENRKPDDSCSGNMMYMQHGIYQQIWFFGGKSEVHMSIRCEFLINLLQRVLFYCWMLKFHVTLLQLSTENFSWKQCIFNGNSQTEKALRCKHHLVQRAEFMIYMSL